MGNNRSPENNHSTCKNVVLQNQVFNDQFGPLGHAWQDLWILYIALHIIQKLLASWLSDEDLL